MFLEFINVVAGVMWWPHFGGKLLGMVPITKMKKKMKKVWFFFIYFERKVTGLGLGV